MFKAGFFAEFHFRKLTDCECRVTNKDTFFDDSEQIFKHFRFFDLSTTYTSQTYSAYTRHFHGEFADFIRIFLHFTLSASLPT